MKETVGSCLGHGHCGESWQLTVLDKIFKQRRPKSNHQKHKLWPTRKTIVSAIKQNYGSDLGVQRERGDRKMFQAWGCVSKGDWGQGWGVGTRVRHLDIGNKVARCDAWLSWRGGGCFVSPRAMWDHRSQGTHAPILAPFGIVQTGRAKAKYINRELHLTASCWALFSMPEIQKESVALLIRKPQTPEAQGGLALYKLGHHESVQVTLQWPLWPCPCASILLSLFSWCQAQHCQPSCHSLPSFNCSNVIHLTHIQPLGHSIDVQRVSSEGLAHHALSWSLWW